MRHLDLNRKDADDLLYIFLHIPKTGGATWHYCFKNNYKDDEFFSVYYDRNRFTNREEIDRYLKSLSNEEKSRIKILCGHHLYRDIHEHFNRKPRYIVFLRNPVDRSISHYNHVRRSLELGEGGPALSVLSASGKILTFEEWFMQRKNPQNYMTRFLLKDFLHEDPGRRGLTKGHLEKVKKCLRNFFFIGITENFEEDALFLCYELGMRKLPGRYNVSKKFFIPDDYEKTKRVVLSQCELDQELYEYAVVLNRRFKEERRDFRTILNSMKKMKLAAILKRDFDRARDKIQARAN